jgi:dTDP-4-dehydrorhamnose reductase
MMSPPGILVTGAGGQVGRALRGVIGTARFLSHDDLDVTDGEAVWRAVGEANVVVHLAAMTHVDDCERHPDLALAVNGEGTRNVAGAAAARGARVVYLSTDYVFDGTKREEYREEDPPAPINAYGRSKLEGERHVAEEPANLIVRTSWVFGEGRNFIRTIIDAARAGRPVRVVDDQTGRPTNAGDLAAALAYLIETGTSGLVQVSGDGEPGTWATVAECAIAAAGLPATVEHVDTETYRRMAGREVAPRPANSVLCLARARQLGVPLREWRGSLERYVRAAG